MIEHIAFFQAKPDGAEGMLRELRQFCKDAVDVIPGVEYASAGENFSPHSGGHTHGLVVRLKDREAFEAYLVHPRHKEVAQALPPFIESRILVDYET